MKKLVLVIFCVFAESVLIGAESALQEVRGHSSKLGKLELIMNSDGLEDDYFKLVYLSESFGSQNGIVNHTGCLPVYPCGESAYNRFDLFTESGFHHHLRETWSGTSQLIEVKGRQTYIANGLIDPQELAQWGHERFIVKFTLNYSTNLPKETEGLGHSFTFEGFVEDGEYVGYLDQSNIGRYSWAEWSSTERGRRRWSFTEFYQELRQLLDSNDPIAKQKIYNELFLLKPAPIEAFHGANFHMETIYSQAREKELLSNLHGLTKKAHDNWRQRYQGVGFPDLDMSDIIPGKLIPRKEIADRIREIFSC